MPEAAEPLLLVLNAGSSSLKAKLYALAGVDLNLKATARLEGIGRRHARLRVDDVGFSVGAVSDHARAAEVLLDRLLPGTHAVAHRLLAIGHRIVHGGAQFMAPVRITTDVWQQLDALRELAPLHNPPAMTVVRAAAMRYPGVPLYAVFDTEFFAELPPHVRHYALPAEWRHGRNLRRFGFHGLAHECLVRAARRLGGNRRRLITLQLGNGCSAAAVLDGKPVDTSMGFSPLEGLIMATRPGDLDPACCSSSCAAANRGRRSTTCCIANRVSRVSRMSAATSRALDLEAHGHEGATLALAAFRDRIVKYLGAYAAVLGGPTES